MSGLRRLLVRQLVQHPLQTFLAVLGIALAVAVVLAIDLCNASAGRAFDLAKQSVFGPYTHQISADEAGLEEGLYRQLRIELGLRRLLPTVRGSVRAHDDRMLEIIGLDPVSLYGRNMASGAGVSGIATPFALQVTPGAVMLSRSLAGTLGLDITSVLEVRHNGEIHRLQVIGLLPEDNDLQEEALQDSLIVDISTAQEILEIQGKLSRIDLVLGAAEEERVKPLLHAPAQLTPSTARGNAMEQMTRAFRINLTALSLLALVIGAFLIYNTMTISVLKRRDLMATLRTLGVMDREIYRLILGEALVLALAGTLAGIALGILLSEYLLQLASRTLNDLYFMGEVRTLYLNAWSLAKALLLGMGITLLAAWLPAREAARIPPVLSRLRSLLETETRRRQRPMVLVGIVLLLLAPVVLAASGKSIIGGFAALFLIILSFALFTPWLLVLLIKLLRPLLSILLGLPGVIAARGVLAALSRTQVAVTALMIAISATIGVSIMIGSFRQSVEQWLADYLAADIYITQARSIPEGIDPEIVNEIRKHPEVSDLYSSRWRRIWQGESLTWVYVTGLGEEIFKNYRFVDGPGEGLWQDFFNTDSVIISEPFAWRHDLQRGDQITLPTTQGETRFRVLGIYRDYGSDRGVVTMHTRTDGRHWDDDSAMSLMVSLQSGADAGRIAKSFNAGLLAGSGLQARSNRSLRQQSMAIFDRTFAITEVLRLLTILIATTGILAALMAIQLERGREFAVLRANGLTPGGLGGLVLTESGLMGLISGVLAIPLGLVMAVVLIDVINRRSFGWSMELLLEPRYLAGALLLGLLAGLLAGVYPAWRMARIAPASALRDE